MCTSCHLRWSEREKLVLVLPLPYLTGGGVFDFVFVAFFVFVYICLDVAFAVFDRCLCLCICHLLCLWKVKVKVAIPIELWRRMKYLRGSYSQCCWLEPAPLYLKDLVSCTPPPPPFSSLLVNNLLFSYAFSYRHCAPQATVNMWAASKSGGNSQQNIVGKMYSV